MYKLIYLLSALFAVSSLLSASAFALTTDRESGVNSDGSAKYTDPDDQQPDLLAPVPQPPASQQNNRSGAFGFSSGGASPDSPHFSISGGGLTNGQQQNQDAFDHAYSHLSQ